MRTSSAKFIFFTCCSIAVTWSSFGEHRRLVDVIGGEQLAERLGLRVELPLEVDELLLRLVHRLLDGVDLRRPEADLLLVLHHELRREDPGAGTPAARRAAPPMPAVRAHPVPGAGDRRSAQRAPRARGHGRSCVATSSDGRRYCWTARRRSLTSGQPSVESAQPIDGTVAYTSTP